MFSPKDRKSFETVLSAVRSAFNRLYKFNALKPPTRPIGYHVRSEYEDYLEYCREFAEKFTNPYAERLPMRALEQYGGIEDQLQEKRKATRKKCRNALLTFLYPGYVAGVGDCPDDAVCVAIPDNGEWVSINGGRIGADSTTAVFYHASDLRNLALVLEEAADLFEQAQGTKRADYNASVEALRGVDLDEINHKTDAD